MEEVKLENTITISDKAVIAIKKELEQRKSHTKNIRLGIRGGGCSGFSYVIQYGVADPKDTDATFYLDGLDVIVDPKSMKYLNGVTLDWEENLMHRGFKFTNPNIKAACGCGHSFSVK